MRWHGIADLTQELGKRGTTVKTAGACVGNRRAGPMQAAPLVHSPTLDCTNSITRYLYSSTRSNANLIFYLLRPVAIHGIWLST